MRRHQRDLDRLGICICVVTFDIGPLARDYIASADWDWPLLIDDDRAIYRGNALIRGNWWTIYRPDSIWQYIKLMLRGRLPGRPGSDFRQLGGDVLIDPNGIVQLHCISKSPHDRPTVEKILAVVRAT